MHWVGAVGADVCCRCAVWWSQQHICRLKPEQLLFRLVAGLSTDMIAQARGATVVVTGVVSHFTGRSVQPLPLLETPEGLATTMRHSAGGLRGLSARRHPRLTVCRLHRSIAVCHGADRGGARRSAAEGDRRACRPAARQPARDTPVPACGRRSS